MAAPGLGTPTDPDYPWGATIYGENGTLKLSVVSYEFIPEGDGEPEHGDVVFELDEYPEDRAPWVDPRPNTV